MLSKFCDNEKINLKELSSGSRRHQIARARKRLMQILIEEEGVTLSETARRLGIAASAASKNREKVMVVNSVPQTS